MELSLSAIYVHFVITLPFRPNDSRMWVALGESYEKLKRSQEAKKVGTIDVFKVSFCWFGSACNFEEYCLGLYTRDPISN